MLQLHPWFILPLVLLAACATAGDSEAEAADDFTDPDDSADDSPGDSADDSPADDSPAGDAAPGLPDAGIVLPPLDANLREPPDAAPPPDAPAPDATPPPSFFCTGHTQCDLAAHECCAFLPPEFTSGICGYGNIVFGACFLTGKPDAGP